MPAEGAGEGEKQEEKTDETEEERRGQRVGGVTEQQGREREGEIGSAEKGKRSEG